MPENTILENLLRGLFKSYNLVQSLLNHLLPMENKDYLILCEGKTEQGFFDALLEDYGLTDLVEVRQLVQTPEQLKETVKFLLPRYKRIALVYDHDNDVTAVSIFSELSKNLSVIPADSNPCFEVFFLACLKPRSEYLRLLALAESDLSPQKQVYKLLKSLDPSYNKGYLEGRSLYYRYRPILKQGIANQKQLRRSPVSHVGHLIEVLDLMRLIRVNTPPPSRFQPLFCNLDVHLPTS